MRSGALVPWLLLVASLPLACDRAGGPGISDEFGDAGVGFVSGIKCLPVLSGEPLPARAVVTDPAQGAAGDDVVFTSVLYQRFGTYCGNCHVQQSSGGFVVTRNTFAQQLTQAVIDTRIKNDNPTAFMPPPNYGGTAYSARAPDDPLVKWVALLELWIQQGSPPGQFFLPPPGGTDGGAPLRQGAPAAQADYSLPPDVGANLTNIGSCVPNKYAIGINGQTMASLDVFFANATELPNTLAETDLTTFDSDTLSRNGVVSFVPAFPLWSDAAGKMRHVRTPLGQPIVFDKSTQQFHIPPNTRFYKTFFKPIIDVDGAEAYKKIETRLIVARPDKTLPDGTVVETALYGAYVWDASETKATLVDERLHNGKPFADSVLTYVVDEPRAQEIRAATPATDNLEYALDTASPPVRRRYAVPGSPRCIQCHMGSPSASFVLGFTPLQVATVPPGKSGVVEAATGDELTQLQRLIDYRVIVGMTSPLDVTPLEKTQLPRTPRNDYELQAQAYMVGNCAHCHNPRGFPSTKSPELKDVLNFLPGPEGGIFQFPLERTSPGRARGAAHDVPIAYITPSLRDLPTQGSSTYHVKHRVCPGDELGTDGWCATVSSAPYVEFIDAPWRSLIYRNVDTPFDYVDDLTIFPHMPMSTPGHDCRVPQIMGDWMVSIPAVNPNAAHEDDVSEHGDRTPQPYVEVRPGDAGYAQAQSDARKRLARYHAGHRYNFCPSTDDIVDPAVSSGARQSPADVPIYDKTSPERQVMPADGVPDRPNWVVTDATDPPGDWLPRNSGWKAALVDHVADASGTGATLADLQAVIDSLPSVTVDGAGVRAALLAEVPFGLWKQKPGCDFTGVPTVGSFAGALRPAWMDYVPLDPGAPVYLQSPGAAVFTNICLNCHGPQADAKGLLADENALMTGGDARVANFRAGLFGPVGVPGANRARVFRPDPADPHAPLPGSGSPDDHAARYLAWMALGGTKKQIPPDLLQVVATSPVVGVSRERISVRGSPNMLQLAQKLCANVLLAENNGAVSLGQLPRSFPTNWSVTTPLIGKNGDAELWLKVCSLANRPVVRVLVPGANGAPVPWAAANQLLITAKSLYWGDGVGSDGLGVFPASAPVMDQRGQIGMGLGPDNVFPLCVQTPSEPAERAAADAFLRTHPVGETGGSEIPYCPNALFATGADGTGALVQKWRLGFGPDRDGNLVYPDANRWAIRGAINAGVAVFLYVDQLSKGLATPRPLYNQCELLRQPAGP